MNPPRFVYFDLGNVLLNFDHSIALHRVARQTGLSAAKVEQAIFTSGLQQRYERGEISSREFVGEFQSSTGARVDEQEMLRNCSDIFELNTRIIPVVSQLRHAGFRLGLLSNTCAAHWEFVSQHHFGVFESLFEVTILSYEQRVMKPDPTIYDAAISAAGVAPAEIFFTDDRTENVDGGQLAGLDATLFRGVDELIDDLRQRGVSLER